MTIRIFAMSVRLYRDQPIESRHADRHARAPRPDRGPRVTRAAGHADVRQRAPRRGHRRGARHARARTTSARRSSSSARTSAAPGARALLERAVAEGHWVGNHTHAPRRAVRRPRRSRAARARGRARRSALLGGLAHPRPPVPALRRWRRAGAAAAERRPRALPRRRRLHAGALELRPARLGAAARAGSSPAWREVGSAGLVARRPARQRRRGDEPPGRAPRASPRRRASRSSRISPTPASRSSGAWCAGSSTHSWQLRWEEVDDDAGGDLGGRADPPRRAPGPDGHRHLHRGRDRRPSPTPG